jgi:hypothetical protein
MLTETSYMYSLDSVKNIMFVWIFLCFHIFKFWNIFKSLNHSWKPQTPKSFLRFEPAAIYTQMLS